MKNKHCLKTILALALLAALGGCSSESDMAELEQFVERTVNRQPGQIEPLPQFVSYQPFTYSAASLRSPFEAPVEVAAITRPPGEEVKPDENRVREFLEGFPISSLSMVGSLRRAGENFALIRDEAGEIHRVTVGNYLGRNHGRIVGVSPSQVNVIEIVPSGDGGWIERPQTMILREPGAPVVPLQE